MERGATAAGSCSQADPEVPNQGFLGGPPNLSQSVGEVHATYSLLKSPAVTAPLPRARPPSPWARFYQPRVPSRGWSERASPLPRTSPRWEGFSDVSTEAFCFLGKRGP